MPGGPKLVHLTFQIDEGPKVKIRTIDFVGNKAISDGTLRKQMKENKQRGFIWRCGCSPAASTYQEAKFDEDAEKVVEYYRDRGYITARVGAPGAEGRRAIRRTRRRGWSSCGFRSPKGNALQGRRLRLRRQHGREERRPAAAVQGRRRASSTARRRSARGSRRRARSTAPAATSSSPAIPDYKFRDDPNPAEPADARRRSRRRSAAQAGRRRRSSTSRCGCRKGKQFFVNRITFTGNTTTRDNVIRREMRLVEDGVFNTEALKYSVKRLNQLGYFKPLEGGKDVDVQKTPGDDNKVDVKLKLEEQNRNQLTFGAGVSEFEGFFGQMSFQTANFLGRGESLTLSVQSGSRAQNYSARVHRAVPVRSQHHRRRQPVQARHPLRRPVHAGVDRRRRRRFGFPLGAASRGMFTNYSYERVRVTEISDVYTDPLVLARNPYPARFAADRRRAASASSARSCRASSTTRSINPIFPTTGKRFTAVDRPRRPRRQHELLQADRSRASGTRSRTAGMSLGMRAQCEYIHAFSGSKELPIFEKLFLGGEYSVRGFDIRTIGPQDPATGLVLGGNKSLLFNIEELITIAGPVRLVLFYDAGQVQPGPELLGPAAVRADRRVLRHRRSCPGKNFNLAGLQDLDRRRDPVLHAGAERAVPADLRLQPAARGRARQQLPAAEGVPVPVCRRVDLLTGRRARELISASPDLV